MYNFEDLKVGGKYKPWGNDINQGLDCMGLVTHCLEKRGIKASHLLDRKHDTFMTEANSGNWSVFDIDKELVGDKTVVLGFLNTEARIDHVGVMANNDEFWHCPGDTGIMKSRLSRPFWQKRKEAGRLVFYVYNGK